MDDDTARILGKSIFAGVVYVIFTARLAPGHLAGLPPLVTPHETGAPAVSTARREPPVTAPERMDVTAPSPAEATVEGWSHYRFSSNACSDPSLGKLAPQGALALEDIFELNLVADDLPASFQQQLEQRLLNLFRVYRALLGREHLRRVALNLRLFADRERYEQYILAQGAADVDSQGVYFGRLISGAIHVRYPRQGLRTTVHEAVHAINHALIGATPRWLNEGLAEYLETIDGAAASPGVGLNGSWLNRDNTFRYEFFDFSTLINSESYWLPGTEERRVLYGNSWHWIHFLMDAPHRVELLSGLLKAELAAPCTPMDGSSYYQHLTAGAPNIEIDFLNWQGAKLQPHQLAVDSQNE